MNKLNVIIEKYSEAKKQFQAEATQLLKEEFKEFFKKVPEVKVIKWTQYTPYFNDGDPCEFTGLCVVNECLGSQAMGLGESVLRDIILSESYRQNFFSSDFRIREITQGNQIVNAINRQALYFRTYLQHSVPRFNNPSGTFDNDQYLLELIFTSAISGTAFVNATEDWLDNCGVCEIEVGVNGFNCESTCSAIAFPALPAQCGI